MAKPNKPGRPKVKDKVRVVSAYLTDDQKKKILKKYGKLTDAIKIEILPKCG
jgi:hypothetical protein